MSKEGPVGPVGYIKGGTHPEHYPETTVPEVAFIGRSNAGKSTLINSLTGSKSLARTSSTPGRTQAIQFFDVAGQYVFADLPGYGYAKAPSSVRRQFGPMMRNYLGSRDTLAVVVLIVDIRRTFGPDEEKLLDLIEEHERNLLLVLNKADKLSKSKIRLQVRKIAESAGLEPDHFHTYSGRTGAGRKDLWAAIRESAAPASAESE